VPARVAQGLDIGRRIAGDERHPAHPPRRELGLEDRQDCLGPSPLEQVPQALELGCRGLLDVASKPHTAE
jgi:hypothetical protein